VIPIIEELTEVDFIYTSKLIVAELIAGAKNRIEAQRLEQDFEGYRFCAEDIGLFRDAGYTRQAYMHSFRRKPIPGLSIAISLILPRRRNSWFSPRIDPYNLWLSFKGLKVFSSRSSQESFPTSRSMRRASTSLREWLESHWSSRPRPTIPRTLRRCGLNFSAGFQTGIKDVCPHLERGSRFQALSVFGQIPRECSKECQPVATD
jgi:hypothetical protein